VLFLSSVTSGETYKLTDPIHGKDVAISAEVVYDPSAPVDQKLEAEFIAVVERGGSAPALTALDRLFKLRSQRLRRERDSILAAVRDPGVRQAVDGTVQALNIDDGDVEALRRVIDLPSSVTDRQSYLVWQHNLLMSVSQVRDPKMVPVMNQLVVGKSLSVRKEASRSLEDLADVSSVPFLKKCLADSDVETAYNCLVALSKVTGKPGPDRAAFEKNRMFYQREWER
jgi:hypothetical protein